MLTDAAVKNLRPKSTSYKMTDRDGLYLLISPKGGIAFKYDYRFNGRRESVTLGSYGPAGLSLAKAREKLIDAKRMIAEGVSPALEKQRAKRRLKEARDFAHVAQKWMDTAPMADSTRNMRRSIFNREVLPQWRTRLLSEITPDDLRAHCKSIVDRGAPATAIHVRDIVKQIYAWAILHGEKIDNPADGVAPARRRRPARTGGKGADKGLSAGPGSGRRVARSADASSKSSRRTGGPRREPPIASKRRGGLMAPGSLRLPDLPQGQSGADGSCNASITLQAETRPPAHSVVIRDSSRWRARSRAIFCFTSAR